MIKTTGFSDNFTIEYDMLLKSPNPFEVGSSFQTIKLDIYAVDNEKVLSAEANDCGGGKGSRFSMHAGSQFEAFNWKDGNPDLHAEQNKNLFTSNKVAHVSMWVQKKRTRLYVNETNVFDLPMFLPDGVKMNAIAFGSGIFNDRDENLISNIRIAQ